MFMSTTMQTALQEIGYQPTFFRTHDTARALGKALDGVITPFIKRRKVQVKYQGGIYIARFEGMRNAAFGNTPSDATSSLKMWGAEPGTNSRGKKLLDAKFDKGEAHE
jgi:hypothetical protein